MISGGKKTLLIHDFFLYRGGAERYNILLAEALGADIAASFYSEESLGLFPLGGADHRLISFASEAFGWGIIGVRQLYLAYKFRYSTRFVGEYDQVIFSNDALSAVRNARSGAKKIFFAHSLPRYLFDRRDQYLEKVPFWLRPIYQLIRSQLERTFFSDLSLVDEIWTNSHQLQDQIFQFTGRSSHVIFPPVDMRVFCPGIAIKMLEFPYFLSFSKLSYFKRIDRVVEVFAQRPDLHLILIYGDRDPDKDAILSLADGYPNIHPVRLKDNSLLTHYIRGAVATIFIPQNEDFGMVAIESLSCGTPVIGVDEGGVRETVIDGVNGILLPPGASGRDLDSALERMLINRDEYARHTRSSVEHFSLESFTRRLDHLLQ